MIKFILAIVIVLGLVGVLHFNPLAWTLLVIGLILSSIKITYKRN